MHSVQNTPKAMWLHGIGCVSGHFFYTRKLEVVFRSYYKRLVHRSGSLVGQVQWPQATQWPCHLTLRLPLWSFMPLLFCTLHSTRVLCCEFSWNKQHPSHLLSRAFRLGDHSVPLTTAPIFMTCRMFGGGGIL